MVKMHGIVAVVPLLAMLCQPLSAKAEDYACPPSVMAQSPKVTGSLPEGWNAFTPLTTFFFDNVLIFLGEPTHNASLAPDREFAMNSEEIAVWTFSPGERHVWIGCRYSETDLIVGRELPLSVKECRVHYGPKNHVHRVSCE
ncbi:STY0301 family protein [Oleispirillum naphthae]|uniref:STY0301 family protein n=1 Tax=Oleispirillum naphthae TaxID=2838853 RepID=UPI0030824DAF